MELVRVVAAVIERGGRYLITRRLLGTHLGGLWEFPGGKILAGEKPEAGLERELMEELGGRAIVGELSSRGGGGLPSAVCDETTRQRSRNWWRGEALGTMRRASGTVADPSMVLVSPFPSLAHGMRWRRQW